MDHVQVGQGRLHHHHIRSLGLIQSNFPDSLPGVPGVHLVTLAVPRSRGRIGGVPERTVIRRGVLDGVGQYAHLGETRLVQPVPDRAHPSVHHIGGSHQVRAGLGVAQGHVGEVLEGGVVDDLAAVDEAAVSMIGVGAQTYVRHDQ